MKSLRVAFFNRAFYPEISATSQLLTELAEGLVRNHGCCVSVVAGAPMGSQEKGNPPPGILVYRVYGTRFSKRFLPGRVVNYLTYFLSSCWRSLWLEKPDVVIALTDPPIIGLAAWMCAKRFGAKLVISYRDIFPEVARLLTEKQSTFLEWPIQKINCFLVKRADRVIALGEAMRDRLIQGKGAAPEKVVIISDWADCQAIQPAEKANDFSIKYGLADRFVVMHAGNIGASQNLDIVIEAAESLADLPDLKVVFIGEGVRKEALQNQVRARRISNVTFLPFQPKENLTQTFASADCFVVCLKPGLAGYITPSKLYGILAAGRPYVASVDESCDVARITRQHDCGLLARPTGSDLAQKIRHLYQNRESAQQMGRRARETALNFDRNSGVRSYFELCQNVTGE